MTTHEPQKNRQHLQQLFKAP